MSRLVLALLVVLLAGCTHQADPIYSPPPGGHGALSKPPAALLGAS